MNNNQAALHTTPGCFQANVTTQTGNTLERDCSTPQGCLVAENKPNSYGPGFAATGGGVFAAQIDVTGVYIWFFSVCCPYFFLSFRLLSSQYLSGPTSPPTFNKQPHPLKWTRPLGVSRQQRILTLHAPCKHSSLLSN